MLTILSKRPPSLETSLSHTNPLLSQKFLGQEELQGTQVREASASTGSGSRTLWLSLNLSRQEKELSAQGIVKMVETVLRGSFHTTSVCVPLLGNKNSDNLPSRSMHVLDRGLAHPVLNIPGNWRENEDLWVQNGAGPEAS